MKFLYVLEYDFADGVAPDRITPDGNLEMNFVFSGNSLVRIEQDGNKQNLDQFYIVGRSLKSYSIQKLEKVKMVGVCFYPWGLYAISGIPVDELIDTVISQDLVFGKDARILQSELLRLSSAEDAIRTLESFVIKFVYRNSKKQIDSTVATIAAEIQNSGGCLDLTRLLNESAISARKMQQRFKKNVGFSPGLYQKLVRFNNSLVHLHSGKTLTNVALECGYFDHSHFVRDFRSFAGITPGEYRRERNIYNDLIISQLNA